MNPLPAILDCPNIKNDLINSIILSFVYEILLDYVYYTLYFYYSYLIILISEKSYSINSPL